jgi:hypothetical protein
MPQTSTVRNLLLSFGAFWLSLMTVGPFFLLFGKFTSRFIYGDGVLDAILAGAIESIGRTLAAIFGGLLVLKFADSPKKLRWAFIVPILYVLDAPFRSFHWQIPPTRFDRLWQGIYLIFPAVACAVCIAVVDHLRRTRSEPERTNSRFRALLIASFAIALVGASVSHLNEGNSISTMLRLTVPLWVAWGALVFAAFWRFKSRGFWLLLGAPLTFLWVYDLALRLLTA